MSCCGNCMYHYARKNDDRLGSRKTNKRNYWYCGHPEVSKTRRIYKTCDQGIGCKHFEDRYESDEKVAEWRNRVYKEGNDGKKNHGRRCPGKSQRVVV